MVQPAQCDQFFFELGHIVMRADAATGEQVLEWQGCHCRESSSPNQRETVLFEQQDGQFVPYFTGPCNECRAQAIEPRFGYATFFPSCNKRA